METHDRLPTRDQAKIAVVDDDAATRRLMRAWLEREGYAVTEIATGREAVDRAGEGFSAMCLDLGLDDMNGLDVLEHVCVRCPDLSVIVATAHASPESVVRAMRAGAHDYVMKPFDAQRVLVSVQRAVERTALTRRLSTLDQELLEARALRTIIGGSAAMRAMAAKVKRVLESDVVVCIQGESGTGKELVASAIHYEGHRKAGAFVALNCAAIPENLQEAELFGYERGAFTGATHTTKGRFEQAEGGTLFLDELGDMSPSTQVKLLRVLQEKTFRRIGGTTDIKTNVRVVCATHRDLEAEVAAGRFRQDLYFRLMVFPIETPPLRARLEDIPQLVAHFARGFREDVGRDVSRVSPRALDALMTYAWPGNVRELQNAVHRAMLSCAGDEIDLQDLPEAIQRTSLASLPVRATTHEAVTSSPRELPTLRLDELERLAVHEALRRTQMQIGKAAALLGIGRSTLYRRLADFGVHTEAQSEPS